MNGIAKATKTALTDFNTYNDFHGNNAWTLGTNFSNIGTEFETFVNKYLFPKLSETNIIDEVLGNRFNFLAKEIDFIGQYSEEYVILDSIPVDQNLSKDEILMLKRNYPNIASKLYKNTWFKKLKFTLNDNDVRRNFATLGDACKYAVGVYRKRISDINIAEEREFKAMLIDYSLSVAKDVRKVTSIDDLLKKLKLSLLNLQNNSERHNEANTASGGEIGRYTTVSKLSDLVIITTDEVKEEFLSSNVAQYYNISGLDISNKIISFDDLGGAWRLKEDVTVTKTQADKLTKIGDYQVEQGDIFYKGAIFTFDVTSIFSDKVEEIKPEGELFALVIDARSIRYQRYTKNMLKKFDNPEFNEVNYWLHYHSNKNISPFYNKIVLKG